MSCAELGGDSLHEQPYFAGLTSRRLAYSAASGLPTAAELALYMSAPGEQAPDCTNFPEQHVQGWCCVEQGPT